MKTLIIAAALVASVLSTAVTAQAAPYNFDGAQFFEEMASRSDA